MNKKTTTERVDPNEYKNSVEDYLIYLMHRRTYEFVLEWVTGKNVLDLGCGEGYGDGILAAHAARVTAVDVSDESIAAAAGKYKFPNVTFRRIAPIGEAALPFSDGEFDAVVSMQVIEHIENVPEYLREIRRVLKPGGTLLISTPNAAIRLLPLQAPWNRFHVTEFTAASLRELLSKSFQDVSIKGLSLKEPWLAVERRRTDRNKRLLWPVTLRCIPITMRRRLLKWIWEATQRSKGSTGRPAELPPEDTAVITDQNIERAPSLIAVARRV